MNRPLKETVTKADYKILPTKSKGSPSQKPGKRAGRGRKK